VIPRTVDDYLTFLSKFPEEEAAKKLENPAWHIHEGKPPAQVPPITFSLLLNLVGTVNADEPSVIWGYISSYAPGASAESDPLLDRMVSHAIAYYRDFVKPTKRYRAPEEMERRALEELLQELGKLPADSDAETIQ